jgi:hypothetical protein
LLYVAEKKRPKAESFFQTKALDISAGDDEMARPKKPDQAIKVLMVWLGHEGLAGQPWGSVCFPPSSFQNWGGTAFKEAGQDLVDSLDSEYPVFLGGSVCIL